MPETIPSSKVTLAELANMSLISLQNSTNCIYMTISNQSRGARQLSWASCLTSAGRVTLASETTFLNALARLTGTTLGRKRDICTFDYSVSVMDDHARSTLTQPVEKLFSHINAR